MEGLRILVVEDNPDHALLARLALQRRREVAEVHVAGSVAEALGRLQACGPDAGFHAVITDLKLPDRPGLDLVRALKADPAQAAVPVFALTAAAPDAEVNRLLAAGARAVLQKPLDVERFLRLLVPGA